MTPQRLQKVLARAGFGSRRACEEFIEQGRVRVNGVVAVLGSRADPDTDTVEVDGAPVALREDVVYYLLNKPSGVVTSARDPQSRPTVLGLVPPQPRVFPVGRLDRDTSGLMILTNDGDLAMRLTHPRYGVQKKYVAEVTGGGARKLGALRRGVELDDGFAKADDARLVSSAGPRALVEVTVSEGRNRMVRRLLGAVGLQVHSLSRTAFGPLRLGRLKPGGYRNLTRPEVQALWEAATTLVPR